jgi:protein translocase SecG subunit
VKPFQLAAATPAAASHASAAPAPNVSGSPLAVPLQQLTAPQTWFQQHAGWATHIVATLFIIAAISLVFLLAIQTTKQEGLSGSIGGRVESAYRGRLGAEEQLKRLTGAVAVAFVVTAFILSLTGI